MKWPKSRKPGDVFLTVSSVVVLFLSAFLPSAWALIPVSCFFLIQRSKVLGVVGILFFWFSSIVQAWPLSEHIDFGVALSPLSSLDLFALSLFYGAGIVLGFMNMKQWLRFVAFTFVASFLGLFVLSLLAFLEGNVAQLELWSLAQLDSHLFRGFLDPAAVPAELQPFLESWIFPFFKMTILAWGTCLLTLGVVFNLLLVRILSQFPLRPAKLKQRPKKDFWWQFTHFRAPDSLLFPLIMGLALLVLLADPLIPQSFAWASWVGWNLTILALFPALLSGVSLFSYLIPRLPFFLLLLALFVVIINSLLALVLAGLADLLFDFRKRWEARPPKEEM